MLVALVFGIHGEGALGFGHWAGCELVSVNQNEDAWEAEASIGRGIQNGDVYGIIRQGRE